MVHQNIKKKVNYYKLFIYFIMFVIIAKLSYIQIINYQDINNKANQSWDRSFPLQPSRGIIYDTNLNEIATNLPSMSIYVIPSQVKDLNSLANTLANVLNVSSSKIYNKINKKTSIVKIFPEGKNIDNIIAKKISEMRLEGVYLVYDNKRYYPYNELLAHSIGFVGIDNQGLAGIESKYDDLLKGNEGQLNYKLDAKGRLLNGYSSDIISPINGFNIQLTIDLKIQQILERELKNAFLKYEAESIFAIAMDPNNGEILAISSYPSFNLNDYKSYDQEIYNRNLPIWKSYEPGSTFKVFSYAAGLEEKAFDMFKDKYYDDGTEIVDGFTIKSWKKGGHGLQTFLEVLENSSNPGFVEISRRLGKDTLYDYVKKFGFSKKTNVDLIGESSGIFFKKENYNNLENATTSFGQGISVTQIQMVRAFSSVINGGKLFKPKITKAILMPNSNEIIYQIPTIVDNENVISKKTSELMRYALESVVAKGSGRKAYIENYRVGGKTGTAQIAENGVYLQGQYILSFIAALPMSNPEIVVYICMEKPHSLIQYGGTIVGPIMKNVLLDIISYKNISRQDNELSFEYTWMDIKNYPVDNYINMSIKDVKSKHFKFVILGDGDKVISQLPKANEIIEEGKEVILFT
ncbi:MAG: stage V sporulation protein D [Erysipelotrichaceae bacterium]|nr:stage V sporulation protein D [Erysipelotrichaceae bacterium]